MTARLNAAPTNYRRRLRFGLRALLFAVAIVAIALGWWVNGARRQRLAVAAIRAGDPNADIIYDFQVTEAWDSDTGQLRLRKNRSAVSSVPNFLLRIFGHDFFHDVVEVLVHEVDDTSLMNVGEFRNLREATFFYGTTTSAGVAHLRNDSKTTSVNCYTPRKGFFSECA